MSRRVQVPRFFGSIESSLDENIIWLTWLIRLRWVAIVAQLITISFSFRLLYSSWLLIVLVAIMVALVISNLFTMRTLQSGRTITSNRLLVHLSTEVIALTCFFVAAGGPDNPFIMLFVIHVAMAAVMLKRTHAIIVTVLVLACFEIVFPLHFPLILERHFLSPYVLLRGGQWVAFTVLAISISAFTLGVAQALRYHRARLMDTLGRTARTDRLRSVGTLAAGAAHNLNTPLSTIGLRLRRIKNRHQEELTVNDIDVIATQLSRCSDIVEQLLIGAGDPSASHLERRPLGELVWNTLDMWSKGAHVPIKFQDHSSHFAVEVPKIAFGQGLTNLLENAREAQATTDTLDPIEVHVVQRENKGIVLIRDHGVGLPAQSDQMGEPFFTTKPNGTGLGIYVARAVAQGAGGDLTYYEGVGGCTEAHWWFPPADRRGG